MSTAIQKASISTARVGDTVLIGGNQITLTNSNLKTCPFMGVSINGDASLKEVDFVCFPKYYKGRLLGYYRQA